MRTMRGLDPVRTLLVVCLLFSISTTTAASQSARSPWTTEAARDFSCRLSNAAIDGRGTEAGRIEIGWGDVSGYWLQVSLEKSIPAGRWRVESTGKGRAREILTGQGQFWHFRGEPGEKLKLDLASGRDAVLTLESSGKRTRYATGIHGAAEAVREFDECVANIKAAMGTSRSRWTAESSSGRECWLKQSNLGGIRSLDLWFFAPRGQGIFFDVRGSSVKNPVTGVLRIDLPGDASPWLIDTEKDDVDARRKTMLLGELRQLKPPHMTFTPRGAVPVEAKDLLGNLDTAIAMFDVCMATNARLAKAQDNPDSAIRFSVSESEGVCEFTGVYQVAGEGIWLSLLSQQKKHVLKVERRRLAPGYEVRALDLGEIVGARNVEAADAVFELDAAKLGRLRRDLAGAGREFVVHSTRDAGYKMQFGGEVAAVPFAMFDACVHTRFDAR